MLLQYPRWFFTSSENRDAIEEAAGRLRGRRDHRRRRVPQRDLVQREEPRADDARSWATASIPLVMVDGPQGFKSSVPPIDAATSPDLAIVRFHGRRTATWEATGVQTVERFRYLYDERSWPTGRRGSATRGQAKDTHVLFNNCYANYGATNALEMALLLQDLQAPEPA